MKSHITSVMMGPNFVLKRKKEKNGINKPKIFHASSQYLKEQKEEPPRQLLFRYLSAYSKNTLGYSTTPETLSSVLSRNSNAINASSEPSKGAFIPHKDAFLKPNLG